MREILFRGKRVDNGEWVYGDLLQYRVLPVIFDKEKEQHEVFADTVGQYTGLNDKNGKKIFKGDILKSFHFIGPRKNQKNWLYHYVVWNKKRLSWFIANEEWDEEGQNGDGCTNLSYYYTKIQELEIEIIGNISDNPELIEKEE